jgi:hypothetical protein
MMLRSTSNRAAQDGGKIQQVDVQEGVENPTATAMGGPEVNKQQSFNEKALSAAETSGNRASASTAPYQPKKRRLLTRTITSKPSWAFGNNHWSVKKM